MCGPVPNLLWRVVENGSVGWTLDTNLTPRKTPCTRTSFHKREINGGLQPFVGKVGKVFGQTFLPVAVIKAC